MSRILFSLFFFLGQASYLNAQILPKENSSLNYRIVGFSFPFSNKAKSYQLEIAAGSYYSVDSFRKNIVKTLVCRDDKAIAEVPSFGASYSWRVVYTGNNKKITNGELHHFSTQTVPNVDTSLFRLKILKGAVKYSDALVFLDDSKVMYDMAGNPVWFLPRVEGINITPRDLKLSPQGTITFLFNPPYEINYNGDVLWKAPQKGIVSGDYNESCHHEFTRLTNGHYVVLGTEYRAWKPTTGAPGNMQAGQGENDTAYKRTPFGTVIEYDEKGNVVWSWRSFNYFKNSDFVNYIIPSDSHVADAHENAFFFDERNKIIYLSFKNISRILKVKYPGGEVIASYGETLQPGVPQKGNGMFCGQHACNISQKGLLYVFNNNVCEAGGLPKIVMMKEPESEKDSLKKVWECGCTVEGSTPQENKNYRFISGGNVIELPDQSIFACMNGTYSKLFIVSQEKEILWSALSQRWNKTENKWEMSGQYRAFIIPDRKKLERLIWNTANKDQ